METKKTPTKVEMFKKMLTDAVKRKETMLVNFLNDLKPSIEGAITDTKCDEIIVAKINTLATSASEKLKKKEQTIAEQEIYFISLLSYCFFNNLIKVSIDGKKVKVDDKRP